MAIGPDFSRTNGAAAWPSDYAERVYAGVLGKIIGVYLGRPFEGWSYGRLAERFGVITSYVHDAFGVPLVVADDDISGTFTFLRALEDHGFDPDVTPAQIGDTWLNYLIENRTVLWWGGMGASTEHTAYLRLRAGVAAPQSGSINSNGRTVAEQIGAQIFIDGWGLICPGDPERAADFARRAASVSHDGAAIDGAQAVAAMVALAFVESDVNRLLDGARAVIPADGVIARLIADAREWHAAGLDWRAGYRRIEERYGYAKFGGGCHIVPNHALITHALLHGGGDFTTSLSIVNTCGWDTDCNSGNVGCILGVLKGLSGLSGDVDWRGPVADRMYLPTADGGRAVTDALREAGFVVAAAHGLRGMPYAPPKAGARFYFGMPGAMQGFRARAGEIENVQVNGARMLDMRPDRNGLVLATTLTYPTPDARRGGGYSMAACPTLYPGQLVRAQVVAPESNASPHEVRLCLICAYGDELPINGPSYKVRPGETAGIEWQVPDVNGYPIAEVGLASDGRVFLDWLTWDGAPDTIFRGSDSAEAWVNGLDHFESGGEAFRLIQDRGTGLLIQGASQWRDFEVSANITVHLVERAGIAARVQGLRRWIGLLLGRDDTVRLVKARDEERVLAEAPFSWEFGETHHLALEVLGSRIRGFVDGREMLTAEDEPGGGAIAFLVTEGRIGAQEIAVRAR